MNKKNNWNKKYYKIKYKNFRYLNNNKNDYLLDILILIFILLYNIKYK